MAFCGRGLRGYSTPLRPRPRLSHIAPGATSYWRERYAQLPPHKAIANFKNRPPRRRINACPETRKPARYKQMLQLLSDELRQAIAGIGIRTQSLERKQKLLEYPVKRCFLRFTSGIGMFGGQYSGSANPKGFHKWSWTTSGRGNRRNA